MKTLIEKLTSFKNSTPISIRLFEELCLPVSFKKNEVLPTFPNHIDKLYYIKTGIVQGIFINELEEMTAYLTTDGFVIPYYVFSKQVSPIKYIRFLTDTDGWVINLSQACLNDPPLCLILFEIYEECLHASYEREKIIRIKNANDRYIYFLKDHKYLINKISNKIIASFLNIHPKHLSEIKKRN